MNFDDFLAERRQKLLDGWFDLALAGYPTQTQDYLRGQPEPKETPVGRSILEGLSGLLDLLAGQPQGTLQKSPFLENTMQARAALDMCPSEATRFILDLKGPLRAELSREALEGPLASQALAFESRIDDLALTAFSLFTMSREETLKAKAEEIRTATKRTLVEAGIMGTVYKTDLSGAVEDEEKGK